jgi:nucleoside-diphosphate-sugar epimerase
MKVLITGGAGFIGFHVAKYLAEREYDITLCDNLFRGSVDYDLKMLIERENVKFVEIDLIKAENFKVLEKDYDYIYHLAAINGTKYFYEIPHEVLRVNILTLINLLDWLVNTDCKKMVWTSSSETYAGTMKISNLPIPTSEEVALTIEDVFNPRFSYAGSKILGELLCINYSRAFGFNVSIVRPHNIYGPRMGYEHVIPEFIKRIIRKEDPFKIYGGNQSRAFCYIDDFVRGIKLVEESSKTNGEIINIGNDKEEIIITDLAQKMFDLFNFHPELETLPAPKGSIDRRCPNISKAKRLTGYEPHINLESGLQKTYEWYLREV